MTDGPEGEWRLWLVPEPSWGPEHVARMRRLLKCALRSFGFRCVRVEFVEADATGDGVTGGVQHGDQHRD